MPVLTQGKALHASDRLRSWSDRYGALFAVAGIALGAWVGWKDTSRYEWPELLGITLVNAALFSIQFLVVAKFQEMSRKRATEASLFLAVSWAVMLFATFTAAGALCSVFIRDLEIVWKVGVWIANR